MSDVDFAEIAQGIVQKASKAQLGQIMAAIGTTDAAALASFLAAQPAAITQPSLVGLHPLGVVVGGKQISLDLYWWGLRFKIPHDTVDDLSGVADAVAAFLAALGAVVGPAAPWVALAAAYVALEIVLITQLDKKNQKGVYVNMAWIAPGVFIPTPVKS